MAANLQVSRTLMERLCGSPLVLVLLGTLLLIATAVEFLSAGRLGMRARTREQVAGCKALFTLPFTALRR
jgi:hypothetical protein